MFDQDQDAPVTVSPAATPASRLPLFKALAFASPGLPLGALAVALPVYLPHYYAAHLGLDLAAVGGAFMIVRLIDILFDPVIGLVMDRTHTRLGRYKLWMACAVPLFVVASYQLFMAPVGVSSLYLIGWLLAFYIAFSILLLSHLSWAAVIATDYHERSRIFGWIQMVSVVGACAILLLPGVRPMGWFLMAIAPVGVALALARVSETPARRDGVEHFSLRDYWEMISRPDMRRIVAADFCLRLGPGWMSAMYLFFFEDARGFTRAQANLLLFIYIAAGLVGAAVISRVAVRLGKHRTLMIASTGYSLGLAALAFIPRGAFVLVAPSMFVAGFLATGFTLLDRAMVADVSDAVRLESGRQRISLLYAMITSTQKVADALSIGLTFALLSLIGYNPKEGAANGPAAIHGLELVYLAGPIVFVMLGGACYIGYKLDQKRHAQIRADLAARDALSPEAAVLETLNSTGLPSTAIEPEPV